MNNNNETAIAIKLARVKVGISQKEVAKSVGISVNTYRKIEKNPYDYSVDTLEKIAKALDTNLACFLLA